MALVESTERINLDGINHIGDWVKQACEKYADNPAFTCLGKTLTYKEIYQESSAFAAYLQTNTDLSPGDKIIIQLPSITQYPIAAYGAAMAGLILVNTNPLYTPREMLHQFNDSRAKAIVILSDLLPLAEEVIPQTDITTVITTHAADLLTPQPQGSAVLNSVSLLEAIDIGRSKTLQPITAKIDDLAVLQYTGGTTGLSKGAMLSHRNVLSNSLQTKSRLESVITDGEDILISPLPLYHIYAFNLTLLLYTNIGAHSILIPNPRDMSAFIAAMQGVKFTALSGLNTLFVGLCMTPEFKGLDFSALKLTLSGGTALTSSAANTWEDVTGCKVSEGYGLSETAPVLTFNNPQGAQLGSIGYALVGTKIKLLNALGNEVPEGEAGELSAKGPQVMQGYWRNQSATDDVMTPDGYFKTGDIATCDKQGNYKIVDRKKDMIIVSGFNVYPNEVEEVLSSHEGIIEAAVIGVPLEKTGEAVRAYIVKNEQNKHLTAEDVIHYCKTQLTAYKVPKDVHFIDELPKSAVGKILRRELRTQ